MQRNMKSRLERRLNDRREIESQRRRDAEVRDTLDALMQTIRRGDEPKRLQQAISAHKGDLNRCKVPGGTPLIYAAWCNNVDAVVTLINEGGADPNQSTDEGDFNPLSMAALNGHNAVVQTLVSFGADVNIQTLDHGYTPLIMAAAHGQAQSWPCRALQPNELFCPDP